ncbi:MAG TPA: hydroxymethylbilane synthase [Tepidisphaeraceae bacterium]|nr:hydroxymethylbilane synthase [Tepidisphaeraceae bacterium]
MGTPNQTMTLRLGTRGSSLARRQSQMIADLLEKHHPELVVELIICKTTGDRIQDKPLYEVGGKGVFTKELEEALLAKTVDFAVHSFKDVPVTMPLVEQGNLTIAAVPHREDVRDVLVSFEAKSIEDLPKGANVGTGSLRRRCQLLAIRPDLKVELIRGNIDTRIRKQRRGAHDAVVLALAGLKRGGLFDDADMTPIPVEQILPAAAQGALAIQCRRDDEKTRQLLAVLDDPTTHRCVDLERALVQALNGDCHSPIAAYANMEAKQFHLRAAVSARGGELPVIHADATSTDPQASLVAVMKSLESQHVRALLAGTSRS